MHLPVLACVILCLTAVLAAPATRPRTRAGPAVRNRPTLMAPQPWPDITVCEWKELLCSDVLLRQCARDYPHNWADVPCAELLDGCPSHADQCGFSLCSDVIPGIPCTSSATNPDGIPLY